MSGHIPVSPYFDIKKDIHGNQFMEVYLQGIALLRLVLTNKGTAFTQEERIALGLDGLLPPQYNSLDQQIERLYRGYRREISPLAKYQFLRALQERSEVLFYGLLEKHLEEMMPIVYTPTVGEAVQEFSHRYQSPRGISLSPINIDRAVKVMRNYPWNDVRMIVATDSSAILGLGDQGYGGLAIAIGKLALYTVGGGVSPFHTMPVKLDVGTDRLDLINDDFYLGVRQRRLRGPDYLEFLDKFVDAVYLRWPNAVIQWEDLSKDVAFRVLERYRDRIPCFNDDIQGTGAVALAGVLSACALKNESLLDQRIAISGAGAGGAGVAWALIEGLKRAGLSDEDARARLFLLDSKGLLIKGRGMESYKVPYAQDPAAIAGWNILGTVPTLQEVIENAGITVLLGLSGQAGSFKQSMVAAICRNTPRPIIFPLSNPTSSSEALPEDLIHWSEGRAMVATGSPFPDVSYQGTMHNIGQGNNAFIFPGLGFGAILSQASRITDSMVLEAAYALHDYTLEHHLGAGRFYPPVSELQQISLKVTLRVIQESIKEGVCQRKNKLEALDLRDYVSSRFWKPKYLPVVLGEQIRGVY